MSASSPFLLLGDHAGRAIPSTLGDLGVDPLDMQRHIAWDIGVAGMGAALSRILDAPFISQAYSRLVIDCNRTPGAPGSIVQESDGSIIPGNGSLTAAEREARVRAVFTPYHDRIAAVLDGRAERGLKTVLVSLHSFTPSMGGRARPWTFGVLHRGDSPFSRAMLAGLQALTGEVVGDNQPYAMDGADYTVPHHVDPRGIDYLELEVRQDRISRPQDEAEIAALAAPLLIQALQAQR